MSDQQKRKDSIVFPERFHTVDSQIKEIEYSWKWGFYFSRHAAHFSAEQSGNNAKRAKICVEPLL